MSEEEIINRLYTLSNEVLKVVGTKRIIVDKNIFLEAINLIEKQQKEIEELKKENKQLKQCNKNLVAEIEYLEEKNDE